MASSIKFRLKRDVVECLRSSGNNSLDYDTLKEMLVTRFFMKAPAASIISSNSDVGGSRRRLIETEKDKLTSRLVKLINRNSHMFSKCAKTYQLKA